MKHEEKCEVTQKRFEKKNWFLGCMQNFGICEEWWQGEQSNQKVTGNVLNEMLKVGKEVHPLGLRFEQLKEATPAGKVDNKSGDIFPSGSSN